jgi:hypothetical protein
LRRIGLYSLIAFTSLALVGILAAGIGSALNSRNEETRVAQATPPTVSEPPAPETAPEETEEEQTEEQESAAEQQAAQEAAEQRVAGDRATARGRGAGGG